MLHESCLNDSVFHSCYSPLGPVFLNHLLSMQESLKIIQCDWIATRSEVERCWSECSSLAFFNWWATLLILLAINRPTVS